MIGIVKVVHCWASVTVFQQPTLHRWTYFIKSIPNFPPVLFWTFFFYLSASLLDSWTLFLGLLTSLTIFVLYGIILNDIPFTTPNPLACLTVFNPFILNLWMSFVSWSISPLFMGEFNIFSFRNIIDIKGWLTSYCVLL